MFEVKKLGKIFLLRTDILRPENATPWFKCIYGYMYVNIMNIYKDKTNKIKKMIFKKIIIIKKRNNYSSDICIRINGYF